MQAHASPILDLDSTRVLFVDVDSVVLRDIARASNTTVGNAVRGGGWSNNFGIYGWLGPKGASWGSAAGSFAWRPDIGAVTLTRPELAFGHPHLLNGRSAVWLVSTPRSGRKTIVRSLIDDRETQADWPVYEDAYGGTIETGWFALGSDGSVLAVSPERVGSAGKCVIRRLANGALMTIGSIMTADASSCPRLLLYDGINVTYFSGPPWSIHTMDAAGRDTLLAERTYVIEASQGVYAVDSGWTAYLRAGPSGVDQVWVRAPDGAQTQLTFFSAPSTIETIGPTGEVMFKNTGKRYFARAGVASVPISSALGRAFHRCDGWYVVIGHAILEVTVPAASAGYPCPPPSVPPDGGMPDGSSSGDGADAATATPDAQDASDATTDVTRADVMSTGGAADAAPDLADAGHATADVMRADVMSTGGAPDATGADGGAIDAAATLDARTDRAPDTKHKGGGSGGCSYARGSGATSKGDSVALLFTMLVACFLWGRRLGRSPL